MNGKQVNPENVVRQRFSARTLLTEWSRKPPKVAALLPLLYLHGLPSLDFAPALDQLLGSAPPQGPPREGVTVPAGP